MGIESSNILNGFMELIADDPRIGPTHISLYLAILQAYRHQESMPVYVFSKGLMKQAKISAIATYRKCIRDLTEFGYLEYTPSFNPYTGSMINILNTQR